MKGVEIREGSIRVCFSLAGKKHKATLTGAGGVPLAPTGPNVKHAERVAASVREKIRLGTFTWSEFPDHPMARLSSPPKAEAKFGDVADSWLKSKSELSEATKSQYTGDVGLWKVILGVDKPVEELTYQYLTERIGGHPWPSPKRRNNSLIVLRGILGFHFAGPRAGLNPMAGIKNVKTVKKLPDPLTAEEMVTVLDHMKKHFDARAWAYFAFAFATGARPEEIIALRWSDVDFRSRTVRIQRVRTFRGSERDGTKTGAERDVDLVDLAVDALKAMKPWTLAKGQDSDIFESPITGKAWHDERSQRENFWAPALKRLGIRSRRAYCTRHTCATLAIMAGANPSYISKQLGHDVRVLLSTYARWIDGADRGRESGKIQAAMNEAFGVKSSPEVPQRSNAGNKKAPVLK